MLCVNEQGETETYENGKLSNLKIVRVKTILVHLEILDLSDNSMMNFVSAVEMPFLKVLKLRNNRISRFEILKPLVVLEELDLSRNALEDLVLDGDIMPSLKYLAAENNRLKSFSTLRPLPSLVHLYLCGNQFESFGGSGTYFPSLTSIQITRNPLKTVEIYEREFPRLHSLGMRDTQSSVSIYLRCPSLVSVHTQGCEIFSLALVEKSFRGSN